MATARTTGTVAKPGQGKQVGRKRVHPPGYKRQVPSAYIWPKIPEGTAALQDCMSSICRHPIDYTPSTFTYQLERWMQTVWSIWRARNKGIAGVSYGRSSLAVIGSPLETIGQRSFGRMGD